MLLKPLQHGLAQLSLELPLEQQKKLMLFLALLAKWNKAFNLTAITNIEKMVAYHLLDSLAVVPFVKGNTILDVGTGAGFPGIPLSCYFPDKHFLLIDGNGKKTRFLTQAKIELGFPNVEIQQVRAEKLTQTFDTVVARGVGSIKTITDQCAHLLKLNGSLVLLKADVPKGERAEINQPVEVKELVVPGVEALRHVVIFNQRGKHYER